MNVDFFLIDESTADEIKKIYPRFLSSEQSKEALNEKIELWNDLQEQEAERENNKHSREDNYGSNWNNDYYNDGLDLDQQSPEWWDSL